LIAALVGLDLVAIGDVVWNHEQALDRLQPYFGNAF